MCESSQRPVIPAGTVLHESLVSMTSGLAVRLLLPAELDPCPEENPREGEPDNSRPDVQERILAVVFVVVEPSQPELHQKHDRAEEADDPGQN